MKILGMSPGLLLTEENCFANRSCIQTATRYSNTNTDFSLVPANIYINDPDGYRASGSFLFPRRDKKYFSNSDQGMIQHEPVLYKNIIEKKLLINLNNKYEN